MVEKLKKISNKKIVIVTSIVMLLVLIASVSYAIWSRSFTQTGTNLSKYDCFDIVYAENVNEVSLSNGYPITDEEGLKAESYDLTIKNTCKILANYEVVLNKLNTSTLNDTNVKIAVDSDISLLSDLKTTNTNLTNATEGKVLTTGILASGQSKTIKIQSWMDENTMKADGASKSFAYKVTAEATTNTISNTLIASILNNKINTEIPDFSKGEPQTKGVYTGSGLYKTEDDDGDSYYFRGKIDNNYIKFGTYQKQQNIYIVGRNHEKEVGNEISTKDKEEAENLCNDYYNIDYNYESAQACIDDIYTLKKGDPIMWQIVRINGDGSIRVVTADPISKEAFNNNDTTNDTKYVGYTYDNSKPNTGDGTSSNIKNYLDNWYNENMNSLNDKIVYSRFCNDTSFTTSSDSMYYGAYTRASNNKPSLKCPETTLTYGGRYNLKIALLSSDEFQFAGLTYYDTAHGSNDENYLNSYNIGYMSLSPFTTSLSNKIGDIINNIGNELNAFPYYDGYSNVYPVINLKSDVQITSGDGSLSNPYIIE